MHAILLKEGALPSKKAEAMSWVERCKPYLEEAVYERLYTLMQDIPDTTQILHGDFHFKNIMQQGDENLLIDMDTLSAGHPIFEFAAMFLAYIGFGCVDDTNIPRFLGMENETAMRIWKQTLKSYFEGKDAAYLEQIERKASIIGYTRLLRRSAEKVGKDTEMGAKLIAYSKNYIVENINKVDSLYF